MPQIPTAHPPQRWWRYLDRKDWKSFFAAWLGVLLDGYDFVLISFALPGIMHTFHLSLLQGAALVSAAFISRWLGGLILGAFGDRFGRRPAMVLSIVLFAVGSLACAFAPHYTVLFLARLLIGFAMAGEYSASATYVIESWPAHMRNKASRFLLSGYAFGVIAAAQVSKYLGNWVDHWHADWGWRALFLTGVIPILVALYMRKRLPEAKEWQRSTEHSSTSNPRSSDMLAILFHGRSRWPNILGVCAAAVALLLIFTNTVHSALLIAGLSVLAAGVFIAFIVQFNRARWITAVAITLTIFASFMYTWPIQGLLPTYLSGVGMSAGLVADIVSFAGLGNALGYVVAGILGDTLGLRRWYVISLLISQVLVFPLFALGGSAAIAVAGLLFFQQMFRQGITGLLPKWVTSYFPVERRAAGLGFCYNVGALGGALGPLLGAAVSATIPLGYALAILSAGFAPS